ncbi:MAG: hypothetical protein ACLT64_05905 [Streptococcus salivarius]
MKRKELLDNIKLILPLLNQYNDGTIHVQISFLQGLECALENGDSLPTIEKLKISFILQEEVYQTLFGRMIIWND